MTTATLVADVAHLALREAGVGGSFIGLPLTSVISQPHGRPPTLAAARSSPVYTASTPGAFFAFSTSIFFRTA